MKASLAAVTALALTALSGAAPALAADIAAGERSFTSQCATCHVVQNAAGEVLAGRNARQGPNLYGVWGRKAGSGDGFRYGNSIVEAGEKGLLWAEASFVPYVLNPNDFLREYLDDRRARGNMAFRVRSEEDAKNIWAYITSLAPAPEAAGETKTDG